MDEELSHHEQSQLTVLACTRLFRSEHRGLSWHENSARTWNRKETGSKGDYWDHLFPQVALTMLTYWTVKLQHFMDFSLNLRYCCKTIDGGWF